MKFLENFALHLNNSREKNLKVFFVLSDKKASPAFRGREMMTDHLA